MRVADQLVEERRFDVVGRVVVNACDVASVSAYFILKVERAAVGPSASSSSSSKTLRMGVPTRGIENRAGAGARSGAACHGGTCRACAAARACRTDTTGTATSSRSGWLGQHLFLDGVARGSNVGKKVDEGGFAAHTQAPAGRFLSRLHLDDEGETGLARVRRAVQAE